MLFKKSNAIKVLNESKQQLNSIQNVQQANTWKASLKASLIIYLGQSSAIVSRLESLHFTKKVALSNKTYLGTGSENIYDDSKKENFRNLIDNSIQYINSHGLFKDQTKKNWLSNFNNVELNSGLIVVAGIIFTIGNYKGNLDKEREITEIKNQKASLEFQYKDIIIIKNRLVKETDSLKSIIGKR